MTNCPVCSNALSEGDVCCTKCNSDLEGFLHLELAGKQLAKHKRNNRILGAVVLAGIAISAFAWPSDKTVVLPAADETVKLRSENVALQNTVADLKKQLAAKPAPLAAAAPAPKEKPAEKSTVRKHIVKKGETLWVIAEKELGDGYKYAQIVKDNNLTNADSIEEGMELIIKK